MTKEHLFPRWLIQRTGTHQTGVRWGRRRDIPALAATLPLCGNCNDEFGRELEGPVKLLFDDIEASKGISDTEAELLIRWMWKTGGLAWAASSPDGIYSETYTLRERVLWPIDRIRGQLVLAICLFDELHAESEGYPMGMDSHTTCDGIFESGVFSRIAVMVVLDSFAELIPGPFSQYRLLPCRGTSSHAKLFYPQAKFRDDVEAVGVTWAASQELARAHDALAMECRRITQRGRCT